MSTTFLGKFPDENSSEVDSADEFAGPNLPDDIFAGTKKLRDSRNSLSNEQLEDLPDALSPWMMKDEEVKDFIET